MCEFIRVTRPRFRVLIKEGDCGKLMLTINVKLVNYKEILLQ